MIEPAYNSLLISPVSLPLTLLGFNLVDSFLTLSYAMVKALVHIPRFLLIIGVFLFQGFEVRSHITLHSHYITGYRVVAK